MFNFFIEPQGHKFLNQTINLDQVDVDNFNSKRNIQFKSINGFQKKN